MFQTGDMVVYGQLGLCRVVAVGVPSFSPDRSRLYYTLDPVRQQGTVFVPTDSPVFLRPAMTKAEAEAIIDMIPSIRADVCSNANMQQLTQFYSNKLSSHRCEDLICLIASIYTKKQQRSKVNRRIGSVDESYLKRAESLFHGEFAYALGIPEESVSDYISARIRKQTRRQSQNGSSADPSASAATASAATKESSVYVTV